MASVIPNLGSDSWVSDPNKKLTLMFAHALLADNSQSTIYNGSITSIPYIIGVYQNNTIEMTNQLETALSTYFLRGFDTADVTISNTTPTDGKYQLNVSVNVTWNQIPYSLNQAFTVAGGVLTNLFKAINK